MKNKIPLQLLATAYLPEQLLELPGEVVLLLGRSNAGKSSLLNALFHTQLAKVSKHPGKTQSVNYYRASPRLTLVDLPGYGFANRSHRERREWGPLMKTFFDKLPGTPLALILMDSGRDIEEEESQLIEALRDRLISMHLLLTKSDRLNQSARQKRQNSIKRSLEGAGLENSLTWDFVSAKKGEGLEVLRRFIFHYEKGFENPNTGHASSRFKSGPRSRTKKL